ncbi:unnamed protein product [Musa banksii]
MFCRANWPHDIDVSVAEKVFLRQCKRKKATKTAIADDESAVAQLDLKSIKETPEEKQTSFYGPMSGVRSVKRVVETDHTRGSGCWLVSLGRDGRTSNGGRAPTQKACIGGSRQWPLEIKAFSGGTASRR